MRALVLDQSSTCTGWAVVDTAQGTTPKTQLIESGYIKPKQGNGWEDRLLKINEALQGLIVEHKPAVLCWEDIRFVRQRKSQNYMIAGAFELMFYFLAIKQSIDKIERLKITDIKQAATGSAKADKAEVCEAVAKIYKLPFYPQEDQGDALAGAYFWLVMNGGVK